MVTKMKAISQRPEDVGETAPTKRSRALGAAELERITGGADWEPPRRS
jgi:hypothetical protein